MKIKRLFTEAGTPVVDQIEWKTVDALIKDGRTDAIVFEMRGVEVPAGWSQDATNILAQKYLRKRGVPVAVIADPEPNVPNFLWRSKGPGAASGGETSTRQVFHRMAGCWTYWGWKEGLFTTQEDAQAFYDEMFMMLALQVGAPNSPQFFNTGLHWAYGIEGSASGQWYVPEGTEHEREANWPIAIQTRNSYERPQPHACFIQSVEDDLVNPGGLMDLWLREAKIFKYGSGSGVNPSKIRGKDELLAGGGRSSGLMSFLKVGDRSAAAIKSGGTCLTGDTPVMTERGFRRVKDLVGERFVVFSIEGPAVIPKWAVAFISGEKECVRVTTDKGIFEVSCDHPFLTKTGRYVPAEELRVNSLPTGRHYSMSYATHTRWHNNRGMVSDRCPHCASDGDVWRGEDRLSQRKFRYSKDGYPIFQMFEPEDGVKEYKSVHRMIANALVGPIEGMIVHHGRGKLDAHPDSLEIKSQSDHARDHMLQPDRLALQREVARNVANRLVSEGTHPFQTMTFPRDGANNGMHRSGSFWADSEKSRAYRELKRQEIAGRARLMQQISRRGRLLNVAYKIMEAGGDVSSFEGYCSARREHLRGQGGDPQKLRSTIDGLFGSYDNFYQELAARNHVIQSVDSIGIHPVYDVQVECSSPEDHSERDYHNFAIGDLNFTDPWFGYVTFVHNTRRAAKMVCVDADHPEIEDFIEWKSTEETTAASIAVGSSVIAEHLNNIASMVKHSCPQDHLEAARAEAEEAGIPSSLIDRALTGEGDWPVHEASSYEGYAIEEVSGQNSNNSVRVPNALLERIDANEEWNLTRRTDGGVYKTMLARDLWNKICHSAWASGDPGVQYDTIINEWATCPNDGRIEASNPCSEYMHNSDTACNLASLNLVAFTNEGAFDYERYEHATRLYTIALEISVYMASFPSAAIAVGSYNYRTLGLGFANLGGLLMRSALPYDSDEGRAWAAGLTALMTGVAYRTSAEMAEEVGPFPRWEANQEPMRRVLRNHAIACHSPNARYKGLSIEPPPYLVDLVPPTLQDRIESAWVSVLSAKSFRNAQVTLVAPTGTISFVMDCSCTGIEPAFALKSYKTLAGGGTMKLVNPDVEIALRAFDPNDEDGLTGELLNHINKHGTLENLDTIVNDDGREFKFGGERFERLKAVFDCAVPADGFERCLEPMAHVRMVAACQPFLSGAASKTVNLPRTATVADVDEIYRAAHRLGIKAVALYRDGCKLSQPLSTSAGVQDDVLPIAREDRGTPLPIEYGADRTEVKAWDSVISKGVQGVYAVRPSDMLEIYEKGKTQLARGERERPGGEHSARVIKTHVGEHSVHLTVGEYPDGRPCEIFLTIGRDGSDVRAWAGAFSKMVSLALQYGMPLDRVIEACEFTQFEPRGIVDGHSRVKMCASIVDLVARILGVTYAGRDDLAQVNLVSALAEVSTSSAEVILQPKSVPRAKPTGRTCPRCHNDALVRTGTCVTCRCCEYNEGCQ